MARIALNDFTRAWSILRDEVLAAVERVGESGWWILGDEVRSFEASLARFSGLAHCVSCASGLDALEIGLRCAGLQPGDRVLTTPLSAFATTLAVVRAGGAPVFCDVDDSGLIDLRLAAEAMEADAGLRFVVPVHLYGHAVDRRALAALRDRFDACIVEDCAQAIGARSHGEPVGRVGDFAATSFYPTKNLGAMGDGGAVLNARSEGAERARVLRDYGQSAKFEHSELGLNSRLDEVQAAILGRVFLPRLDEWNRRRAQIAKRYLVEIRHPGLAPTPSPSGSESSWHLFPVLVSGSRDSFRAHLEAKGVASGVHYPILIPDQKALAKCAETATLTPLSNARRFARSEVSLPIHPFLSDEEVSSVIRGCNDWTG
jgi:dTDP-4-amino-4,6-dideoxygalactose transaminase